MNASTGRLLAISAWCCGALALGVLVGCCSGTSPVIAGLSRTKPLETQDSIDGL